jgi:hypothetical protein
MDTITKHRKKLIKPYEPSRNSAEVISSAKELAVAVLRHPTLIAKHKRKILPEVQWLISEVDGKYSTRYRSKRVVDLTTSSPESTEKIEALQEGQNRSLRYEHRPSH